MLSKQEARKIQKAGIRSVPSRNEKEERIKENLILFLRHSSSSNVLRIISYVSDEFEISCFSPTSFIQLQDLRFDLFFPKITEEGLEFREGLEFSKGPFGILEPTGKKTLVPKDADWILVPALGWNREGARLGRGKGFYDKSMQNVPSQKMIGLSFEDLYPCEFSAEPHDLRVGTVITEKKNHCFPHKIGEKSVR
ncbi:5-formyltetrahydrofolate cyclo-ligase [Leptospira langatensis]|uniref:5-formyltetrahydrofolate cyclo-ligase n=1 Tax=Leptospira langatensis TaxID=2484983 RepID=A0A5F1ZVT1_9LEPT|nr:5-formyltetrahydrofolate cyclo-ligase [Leptospira langatensis]TGK00081.1 5-formyltetrahydrofolate cyclo-ligase [Leptospira langatensis]TGL42715.1 5-formyltetrahydrofolate cyclo-ligase [Leptospira langatensis]